MDADVLRFAQQLRDAFPQVKMLHYADAQGERNAHIWTQTDDAHTVPVCSERQIERWRPVALETGYRGRR